MPRITKSEAPVVVDVPEYEGRFAEVGPYTVSFETFPQDADPTELFAGLPDGRCQCPHWGTVVSGRLVFNYAAHAETFLPGEHYYAEPGHVPLAFAGTEVVEFSPTDALNRTLAAVGQAMAAQRTAGV